MWQFYYEECHAPTYIFAIFFVLFFFPIITGNSFLSNLLQDAAFKLPLGHKLVVFFSSLFPYLNFYPDYEISRGCLRS